ncbi:hypothetical protein C8J57DRAFT_1263891 [Mycena rebaudengoi]|nr:hypothetical protein C8J57DRAFT_1263891 [Mycena rebaudengoi]
MDRRGRHSIGETLEDDGDTRRKSQLDHGCEVLKEPNGAGHNINADITFSTSPFKTSISTFRNIAGLLSTQTTKPSRRRAKSNVEECRPRTDAAERSTGSKYIHEGRGALNSGHLGESVYNLQNGKTAEGISEISRNSSRAYPLSGSTTLVKKCRRYRIVHHESKRRPEGDPRKEKCDNTNGIETKSLCWRLVPEAKNLYVERSFARPFYPEFKDLYRNVRVTTTRDQSVADVYTRSPNRLDPPIIEARRRYTGHNRREENREPRKARQQYIGHEAVDAE